MKKCLRLNPVAARRTDFALPPDARAHRAYRCRRTVILKLAVPALALVSVAEQLTRVRPMRKRVPERGRHVTGTGPSTSSVAVTTYLTRTLFARRGATTVRDFAPMNVG